LSIMSAHLIDCCCCCMHSSSSPSCFVPSAIAFATIAIALLLPISSSPLCWISLIFFSHQIQHHRVAARIASHTVGLGGCFFSWIGTGAGEIVGIMGGLRIRRRRRRRRWK
jgi:apolipoprotein N-acyltransferase